MALILDAGALVGYERRDELAVAFLDAARVAGLELRTTTGAVAQAWRDGARQARLAMLLHGVEEVPLDAAAARRIGALLRSNRSADVVDASLIDICHRGDRVLTSDPEDLAALAAAAGKHLAVIKVG